jgi:sporulation protein YlmC with PRC-barrel domain
VFNLAKSQSFSKSGLVGKDVVDQEGNLVGTVKDVDLAIGKVALVVEDKEGETKTISWDMVQGAADCVILKPVQQAVSMAPQAMQQSSAQSVQPQTAQSAQQSQSTPMCPICGQPLTWIPQYKRWYCYKDQKYA